MTTDTKTTNSNTNDYLSRRHRAIISLGDRLFCWSTVETVWRLRRWPVRPMLSSAGFAVNRVRDHDNRARKCPRHYDERR